MIAPKVKALIAGIIEREGDYGSHPDDRGGPTRWGITEQFTMAMRESAEKTSTALDRNTTAINELDRTITHLRITNGQ